MKEFKAVSKERSLELYTDLINVVKEYQGKDPDEITIVLVEKEIPKTITEAVVLGTMLFHLVEELKSIAEGKKDHYEMPKSN